MEYKEVGSTSNNSRYFNEFIDKRNKLRQEQRDWYEIGNYHRAKYITCESETGKNYHLDKCKQTINNLTKISTKIEELEKLVVDKRQEMLASINEKFKSLEHPD